MKLIFQTQAYQSACVQTVVDCFKEQPSATALELPIDYGDFLAAIKQRISQDRLKLYSRPMLFKC